MRFCVVGHLRLLLDRVDDAVADLDVVAGVLAVAGGVGERRRRVAGADHDLACGLDLGECVVALGLGRSNGQHGGEGEHGLLHGDSFTVLRAQRNQEAAATKF
jgi:hypothetical protein